MSSTTDKVKGPANQAVGKIKKGVGDAKSAIKKAADL